MPVYFIITAITQRVKIGYTGGIARKRLSKLQTDNHEPLSLLRWLEGDRATEAALHKRYAHLRMRGDWFALCETMRGDLGIPDAAPPRKPGAKTPLGRYLIHRDISLSDFARSINVSAQAVHRYVSGERIPHPKIMERIRTATHGTVGPDDFYTRVAA